MFKIKNSSEFSVFAKNQAKIAKTGNFLGESSIYWLIFRKNHYDFWNGIDYYGSFLGIQSRHKVNIIDDLEYLYDSDYFHDNLDKLFETEDINEELLEDDTRSNRKKLVLNNQSFVCY